MEAAETPSTEYRCPGERYPVSRAVHLGRLAAYYPGCRYCPHHDDTGSLSPRRVKRLAETRRRAETHPLLNDEGAAGVYLNDLGPAQARSLAATFGVWLLGQRATIPGDCPDLHGDVRENETVPLGGPVVVIAGDGRPVTPELLAAVGDGLRWSGCHVIEIGPASAPCTAMAIAQLDVDGGILVGNPPGLPYTTGLKFWTHGARPLSAGGPLDAIRQLVERGIDRPTRHAGMLRRYQAEANYLAVLEPLYHALRPLRFVLDTPCPPLPRYVEQLLRPVACQMLPRRDTPNRLAEQILSDGAHFAVLLDDDGQRCRLLDQNARTVAPERLLPLLARCLITLNAEGEAAVFAGSLTSGSASARQRTARRATQPAPERPDFLAVIETTTPGNVVQQIRAFGGRVVTSDPRRSEMERTMRQHDAILGGGPSGRFWYRASQRHFCADALITLTLLLRILSQSDRPLSEVLDASEAVE